VVVFKDKSEEVDQVVLSECQLESSFSGGGDAVPVFSTMG